jgi:hypothetical protein
MTACRSNSIAKIRHYFFFLGPVLVPLSCRVPSPLIQGLVTTKLSAVGTICLEPSDSLMAETHRDQDDPPQQDKPIWDTALSAAKVTYWGFKAGHLILTLVSLIGGFTVYKLSRPVEHIDAEERAIAARLKPSTDLVREEIHAFRSEMRRHFDGGRYADLERAAQDLRTTKALFRNGTWKLTEFYEAFTCERKAPEAVWQQLESRLKAWQAATPQFPHGASGLCKLPDGLCMAGARLRIREYGHEGGLEASQAAAHDVGRVLEKSAVTAGQGSHVVAHRPPCGPRHGVDETGFR